MPRTARKKSCSGYYHVVSKAISDQIIFESDVDRRYYLKLLRTAHADIACGVVSYCIMSNHVHLVLNDSFHVGAHADLMKYVDERYGAYFADKTGRCGGIFRKPYWSEPIETDEYLLCAVRYVHANPFVAGICNAFDYEWSSAREYLAQTGIADSDMVLGMCGGVDGFVKFSAQTTGCAHAFPGSKLFGHITDDEAINIARQTLGEDDLRNITSLPRAERREAVRKLKKTGLAMRQIQRVTGLGYYTLQSA